MLFVKTVSSLVLKNWWFQRCLLKDLTEESSISMIMSEWFDIPLFKNRNLSQVVGGRIPDGKNVMQRARDEAFQYKQNYAINVPGSVFLLHNFPLNNFCCRSLLKEFLNMSTPILYILNTDLSVLLPLLLLGMNLMVIH